jgi:hypothetical protein
MAISTTIFPFESPPHSLLINQRKERRHGVQTENEKAVRDQFEKWYRENRFHMPTEQEDEIAWDAWQAALQSQVSNTDGAEQESLQAENARLKDELEELSDLLFNIRTLPVHGYLTKDEFIAAFRQEINTVPEVRVSKQRQEIEALRKELQAATAAPKAPQQQEQSGEAVTLDGPELWELLFGIFEGDVPRELTDDKIAAIAEAINHAGFTSPAPPTSTAIAAMVIKQAADIVVDRAHTPYAKNWDEVAETIRNLLPANAEEELVKVILKVINEAQEYTEEGVRRALDGEVE